MKIACFDMEGTLTPEIWEQVAKDTGIDDFMKTTRDIPHYDDLMDYRIKLMKENNLLYLISNTLLEKWIYLMVHKRFFKT